MFGDYQIPQIRNVHSCPLDKSSCLFWVQNIKKRKNAAANRTPPNHYNSLLEEGLSGLYITTQWDNNLSWNAELLQLQDIWIFFNLTLDIIQEYFYIWFMYNLQILMTEIGNVLVNSYWLYKLLLGCHHYPDFFKRKFTHQTGSSLRIRATCLLFIFVPHAQNLVDIQ